MLWFFFSIHGSHASNDKLNFFHIPCKVHNTMMKLNSIRTSIAQHELAPIHHINLYVFFLCYSIIAYTRPTYQQYAFQTVVGIYIMQISPCVYQIYSPDHIYISRNSFSSNQTNVNRVYRWPKRINYNTALCVKDP